MAATDSPITESGGLDPGRLQKFADTLLAAWNSHEPDQLLALMTDDVVYDDASWPKQMHGRADVREFLESTWRAIPDLTFEHVHGPLLDPTASRVGSLWHATGTDTGVWDPPGLAPSGRQISFDGADFEELRDGRICSMQVIYDVAGIMRQLGVLPQSGSRGEHLITTMANLRTHLSRH